MKENDSTSWFNLIKRILLKYGLQHPLEYLSNPMCKLGWKKLIQTQINEYWKSRLISDCKLYSSLKYLDYSSFTPNRCHWIIHIDNESNPSREAMLIATKLKLPVATGSYILQQKRATCKFIHNEKPTCKLCDAEDKDVEPGLNINVCPIVLYQ